MSENISCILCKEQKFKILFETKDYNCKYPGNFKIVQCLKCGLIFLNPRPTFQEINQFYPNTYFSIVRDKEKEILYGEEIKQQLKQIKKMEKICKLVHQKPSRILDIGCGLGFFLYCLKEKGWQTYGVEILSSAVSYGKEKLGLNILQGDLLNNTNFPSEYFDIITLWHVLEHLHEPNEILVELNRILKPKGLLIIEVPNIDSFQAKISKDKWYHLDAPRHLFHFSPKTLRMLLEKNGFSVFHISHFGRGEHNLSGLKVSLKKKYKIFQKKIRFFDMILYRSSIIVENLMGWLKHGGTIEIYSRKD